MSSWRTVSADAASWSSPAMAVANTNLHRQEWPRQPDLVVEDLSEAVDTILEERS